MDLLVNAMSSEFAATWLPAVFVPLIGLITPAVFIVLIGRYITATD
ncbi:photosystem I subunit VIII (PsaI) [Prochlorococcus sp. MIT 0603]|nr:photosystem I subunit VIII (PsaI) [Prochlorococcus sp. MIT 0603]